MIRNNMEIRRNTGRREGAQAHAFLIRKNMEIIRNTGMSEGAHAHAFLIRNNKEIRMNTGREGAQARKRGRTRTHISY